jgi:hypothetical protein
MSMLTFVVDCCVYVWRNAHGATCSALTHEALPSDTSRSLLPIVVIVAAAQRDMKMPGARARGIVVDIRRHHHRSCCRRCCDAI